MEHTFSATHKAEYISALRSDASRDNKFKKTSDNVGAYESVLLGDYNSPDEDKVSGMYVTTQQYSNVFLPKIGENVNRTVAEKKEALVLFRRNILALKGRPIQEIIEYTKQFSSKFASIIELTLNSNGPVFIFSNWLTYGVEPLAAILEACGLVSFDKQAPGVNGKYFIWSSETKTKDKDGTLIKKARNTFNSFENRNGELLKVILGTRSVMEGVSFRNVKQVHITEPWWNESRIEQILARASRFCSHSNLPADEQFVDIYRHYSVLPSADDADVMSMFADIGVSYNFRQLATFGIEQKMLMSSIKKQAINTELELILKSCAIDAELNKNGNIIRLEENVIPTGGYYQIFYKNQSNGRLYIREGIPEVVTFDDIYTRKYSFPNKDLPITFTEAAQDTTGLFKPFSDSEVLTEPQINSDLNTTEQIEPWKSDKIFSQLELPENVKNYTSKLYKNYQLLPVLRKNYFKESGGDVIKFKENTIARINLIKCIKELAKQNLVSADTKKQINKEFTKESQKQLMNQKVLDLIYKYNIYPESYLEDLLQLAVERPDIINETLKQMSKK